MLNTAALKYVFTVGACFFLAVPAVDGGMRKLLFIPKDRSPMNSHVKRFVQTYIHENRENLSSIAGRSKSPFRIIESVFKKSGLPVELKYLAVVESELKIKAVSKVGAAGPWQLMPATAHILGLHINGRHDERRDYYKSTRAAALYLKDLHVLYGDWLLVFAAYNSGEGTVNTAIRKSGSRNYWKLQRYLPAETREYVNKFIATCFYFEGGYSPALLSGSDVLPCLTAVTSAAGIQSATLKGHISVQKNIETPEEKFNRILKASDQSLITSNALLNTSR